MKSFATELVTPSVTDVRYVRTYGHLTAFNIQRWCAVSSIQAHSCLFERKCS